MDTDPHKLMSEALVGAGTSVWAWDMSDDVLTGMNGSVALLGYSEGELPSTQAGWNTVIHPEDLTANDAAYLAHAAGLAPSYESEYRALAKNGSWRWLAERGRIVEWWPDGSPRRMVGTLSDVTLRKQAESEAAERDERLRQITRHVPGLLYQFRLPRDGRGTFPYVSERCHDVLGLDPQALMLDAGLLFGRIDPADRQRTNRTLEDWMRNRAARRIEFRYLHPDGRQRWMLGVSSPRPEADGVVWHGYLEDITDYRELERARELAAAAEAANRAKTEFLSRMSHELRTPLNAVLGFSQLLEIDQVDPLTPGQRHRIGLVRESGEHLLRMISDLLDHSRIESGQFTVELTEVPLATLLRECADMLQPAAQAAGVSLRWGDIDEALEVRADPTRLRQVVINLLSNAIKYNRRGGDVRLETHRESRQTVALRVVDTGMGISPAHLPSLFEPFNRLGQRRSGIEGTGIGLAITRGLVTLMQGRIDVNSVLDKGSTFSVVLPDAGTGPDQDVNLPM